MKTDDQLVAAAKSFLHVMDDTPRVTPQMIANATQRIREAVASLVEPEPMPACDDATFVSLLSSHARGEKVIATTRADFQRLVDIARKAQGWRPLFDSAPARQSIEQLEDDVRAAQERSR